MRVSHNGRPPLVHRGAARAVSGPPRCRCRHGGVEANIGVSGVVDFAVQKARAIKSTVGKRLSDLEL